MRTLPIYDKRICCFLVTFDSLHLNNPCSCAAHTHRRASGATVRITCTVHFRIFKAKYLQLEKMLLDHAREGYVRVQDLLKTAVYEKGLSVDEVYDHFSGENIDGISPADFLRGIHKLGVNSAKMADAQIIVRAFVPPERAVNLLTRADFQQILLSSTLPIFDRAAHVSASLKKANQDMPSELDLKVAAVYCSDLAAARPFESFINTSSAVKLRLIYTNPWFSYFVSCIFLAYCVIGAFDEPFDCTPNAYYAEKCEPGKINSWVSTSRILELVIITPILILLTWLQVMFRGIRACVTDFLVAFPGGTHDPHLCLRSCRRCARGLPLWHVEPGHFGPYYFTRLALRPYLVIELSPSLRRSTMQIINAVPNMLPIFALGTFTTWMLAIAGIALALDMNVDGGAPYLAEYNGFNTTGEAMWAMYFWTFATNQPFLQRDNAVNGQHPGAKQNTLWLVYLSVVTVILTLIIGSLLLTAIYESFSKTRGRFLEKQHADSWKLAHAAFEKIDKAKQGTVSLKVVQRMFFFIRTEHSAETAAQHATICVS